MRPYLQAHKRTSMTVHDHIYMTNHSRQFKTIQNHTTPQKDIKEQASLHKAKKIYVSVTHTLI